MGLDGGKPCDCCSSSAALLFCRAHAAFMCLACDSSLHAAADGHQRVWLCGVCEQAPAAVTCRADAAALCVTCDRDIHSANPLARRHDRAPVVPFYDAADALLAPAAGDFVMETFIQDSKLPEVDPEIKPEFYFPDSDHFLDFDNYQICDSLVPVQTGPAKHPVQTETRFEIDFSRPNPVNLYSTQSLSLSVSSSSVDGGIVPDGGGGALSESSHPYPRTMSSQAVGTDREARVLRYKEKRRNRKFEKTIRYASRKAYAETRPRIRGRFVKRTDSEPDIYGTMAGVVPSYIVN